LARGAGSSNVRLVHNKSEAKKLIKKAFNRGFSQFDSWIYLKDRLGGYFSGSDSLIGVFKGFARLFITTDFSRKYSRERGYVFFQDFIPNNAFDIRVIVIGSRAFAIKRMTRKNDFRASGSGIIRYDNKEIDLRCVQIAFEVNRKIGSQCIAFDFIFDNFNKPLIVEVSFGFSASSYDLCPGYWDENLNWFSEVINPQLWMLEELGIFSD
jgi:hypothetical protein